MTSDLYKKSFFLVMLMTRDFYTNLLSYVDDKGLLYENELIILLSYVDDKGLLYIF